MRNNYIRNIYTLFVCIICAALLSCTDASSGGGGATTSSSKNILSYSLAFANGKVESGAINGVNITLSMPSGTVVTNLIATFTTDGKIVKVGGVTQVSGITANNFTTPVVYTVTAADNTTKTYGVSITVAAESAKTLSDYSLKTPNGKVVEAITISDDEKLVILPFGTVVTDLVATFKTDSKIVKVGSVTQVSGITTNNFTTPVVYTVTAADNTTKDYKITVKIGENDAKDITSFSFVNPDVKAIISGNDIAFNNLPYGTDVTNLVALFVTTGESLLVDNKVQVSGVTTQNFSSPVKYIVKAADGTTKEYTVSVTVALNNANAITSFTLNGVTVVPSGTSINFNLPYGADVTNLVASFVTTGESVTVGGIVQNSGTSTNSFNNPVEYVVTAANGDTQTYTVSVSFALNSAKAMNSFVLDNAVGVIDDTNNTVTVSNVPFNTDITKIAAVFQTNPIGLDVLVGTESQYSGITTQDFTTPKVYKVIAADGSIRSYTVTVTKGLLKAKSFTSFLFNGLPGVINDTNNTITFNLPYGASTYNMVDYTTDGADKVFIGNELQTSGMSLYFTNPVTYTLTAPNSDTKQYVVTVNVATSAGLIFESLFVGGYSACGLASNRQIYCWGNATYSPLWKPNLVTLPYGESGFASIYNYPFNAGAGSGNYNACAIGLSKKTYCKGSNYSGQLGNGTIGEYFSNNFVPVTMPSGISFVSIGYAGSNDAPNTDFNGSVCALGSDKKVYCWGSNESGQLGLGYVSTTPVTIPTQVIGVPYASSFTSISHNNNKLTCGVSAEQGVDGNYNTYCWGSNESGQLGNNGALVEVKSIPTLVQPGKKTYNSIATGNNFACGLDESDQHLECWGNNQYGQLATGNFTNYTQATPSNNYRSYFSAISTNSVGIYSNACGLYINTNNKNDPDNATVYCWGASGDIYSGADLVINNVPLAVPQSADGSKQYKTISTNHGTSCAIGQSNGQAYCWGNNFAGTLGVPYASTRYSESPLKISW